MENHEEVELWQSEGFQALSEGDLDAARKFAKRLRDVRHSSCFELEALVYLKERKPKKAIRVLREGTKKAPSVWVLWQLLGNCLSDAADFQGALDSYDAALRLVGNSASLQFNRALVFLRTNDFDSAIEALEAASEGVDDSDDDIALSWRIQSTLASVCASEGQTEKALSLIPPLPEEMDAFEEADGNEIAQSFSDISEALFKCEDVKGAQEWLHLALQKKRSNDAAVRMWRKLHSRQREASTFFRVLLRGNLDAGEVVDGDEETDALGFITGIWVVATNAQEAAELAVEFEAQFWQNLPLVEEVEKPQKCKSQPIGVFEVQGRGFYSSED